jgi:hypothetical protein
MKPFADFNRSSKSKDGYQPQCRACSKAHYQANRSRYIAQIKVTNAARSQRAYRMLWGYLLEHPCVDCRENDPLVLDFDHVRGIKIGNVKSMAADGRPLAVIKAEIAKCEIRCANCHRRKTSREASWFGWLLSQASVAQPDRARAF